MFLLIKTVYFHLWVLCKSDHAYFLLLRINGEIIRINHVSSEKTTLYFTIFDEIKVLCAPLYCILCLRAWTVNSNYAYKLQYSPLNPEMALACF